MDKVGIITPCYNAEEYIGECVDSVSSSVTLGKIGIKHIVVNDGSTDNSGQILKKVNNERLTVITLKNNQGQSIARNTGLKHCSAEKYILFLDADDILFQNSLRYLWETAEKRNCDWVYGDFIKSDAQGKYMGGMDYYGRDFVSINELLFAVFSGKHYFQQNSFFRTSILREVGGFDEKMRMAEDLDLAVRLALKGILPVYLPGPLYIHRFHPGNISVRQTKNPELHLKSLQKMYRKYGKELGSVFTDDQRKQIEETLRYNPGLY